MASKEELRVLLVSQVIPQWYVDLLKSSLPRNCTVDCITGSDVGGVNIFRSPRYDSGSIRTKLVSWLNFYFFVQKWARKSKQLKYDLIFTISNPPLNAFSGVKLKKQFDAPLCYMNWDIYPESIEVVFRNPVIRFVCRIWTILNDICYPKIDQIITIGDIMAESINKSMKKSLEIKVLPIASNTDLIRPIKAKSNPFRQAYGWQDKFIVLYSGNMGMGHNMKIILDAAKQLCSYSEIHFVLIGEGTQYNFVKDMIRDNALSNVTLLPWQPDEMFKYSVACGDVAVVSEDIEQAQLFIPSKVFNFMAAGEAIIGLCSEHDDLQRLIDNNDIGIKVTSNQANDLVKAILLLYDDSDLLKEKQLNARRAVEMKYSLSFVSNAYREMFDNILGNSN